VIVSSHPRRPERGSLMVMGVGCVLVVSGGCCWWMLVDGDGDGVCR